MTPKAYFFQRKFLMLQLLKGKEAKVVQKLVNNNEERAWLVKAGINPLLFLLEELYDES